MGLLDDTPECMGPIRPREAPKHKVVLCIAVMHHEARQAGKRLWHAPRGINSRGHLQTV